MSIPNQQMTVSSDINIDNNALVTNAVSVYIRILKPNEKSL